MVVNLSGSAKVGQIWISHIIVDDKIRSRHNRRNLERRRSNRPISYVPHTMTMRTLWTWNPPVTDG